MRRAALALAVALAGACSPAADRAPRLRLVDELPRVAVHATTRRLDFGEFATRDHFVAGWSIDERAKDGSTWVWSLGRHSSLVFWWYGDGAARLRVRLRPVPPAPGVDSPLAVELRLNGQVVATRDLDGGGFRIVEVPLPAQTLRLGDNLLELVSAGVVRPLGGEKRDLTVAVDWLAIDPREATDGAANQPDAASSPAVAGDSIALPSGHGLRWCFSARQDERIAWSSVTAAGGRGELHLRVLGATGPGATSAASASGGTIQLPGPGPACVDLMAVGSTPGTVFSLAGARVEGVRGTPAEPDAAALAARSSPAAATTPPNLLIVLVDTLRVDRLGCYGYTKDVSPRIDAFAAAAVVFENAFAQAPWTRPSVASLLTGRSAVEHGVRRATDAVAAAVPTLAERLAGAGYRTFAVGTNPHASRASGALRGFGEVLELPATAGSFAPASEVVTRFQNWLERGDGSTPFFAYLHLMEPHAPYEPPEPFRSRFAPGPAPRWASPAQLGRAQGASRRPTVSVPPDVAAAWQLLYDAEVAAADAAFGAVEDALRRRGLWDSTWALVVSDHGEEFGEHGHWEHRKNLYPEVLRVPLILKPAGWSEGRRERALAQHIDVAPTFLRAAGLSVPADFEGRDLAAPIDDPGALEVVAVNWDWSDRPLWSVVHHRVQWMQTTNGSGSLELYDLAADPAAARNLFDPRSATTWVAWTRFFAFRRRHGAEVRGERADHSAEQIDALRALGYLR
jgi:arylsulfatase A-like enzyme